MRNLTIVETNKYLNNGILTTPFLDKRYLLNRVETDFNKKIKNDSNYTKIQSLYNWIHKNIKTTTNKQYKMKYKFQRTAKEIWESGFATGCTDYAILFVTFARQIGIPSTFLHTAEYGWLQELKNGEEISKIHRGHSFCECYYNGKWILVDPTYRKIVFSYNAEKIYLSYLVGNSNIFIPYYRDLDLGKKQSIEEHNEEEERVCSNLKI